MKILTLDIETSPNVADVWSLWNQNVSLNQLRDVTRVICFAAKWHDSKRVEFYSEFHHGKQEMVDQALRLLDAADIAVTYNGDRFDLPHLNREFLLAGLDAPSPYASVDLLKTIKQRFRFSSNKLDHITRQLGLEGKVAHSGHSLWTACLAGDPKAWALMKKYNKQDVVQTELLYDKVRPWIKGHPHMGLYIGEEHCCPNCGSTELVRRGYAYTPTSVFQQWRCECGRWSRSATSEARTTTRGVA